VTINGKGSTGFELGTGNSSFAEKNKVFGNSPRNFL
jgi:hypothetical protein